MVKRWDELLVQMEMCVFASAKCCLRSTAWLFASLFCKVQHLPETRITRVKRICYSSAPVSKAAPGIVEEI